MSSPERRLPIATLSITTLSVLAAVTGAQGEPGGPADPAVVRDRVRDVMSRPAFSYEPSWIERLMRWLGDQLQKLFGDDVPGTPGSFGGGIGTVVAWVLILAAVAALVFLVVRIVATRSRARRSAATEPLSDAEVEHRRRAADWLADAERFESAGAWKEAMRARYRHLIRVLVDRRQLPDLPGMTTGELRVALGSSTSLAADEFDTCCVLFELPWYANVPTGVEDNARFRVAADRVLAAPVDRRFDPGFLTGETALDVGVGADIGVGAEVGTREEVR